MNPPTPPLHQQQLRSSSVSIKVALVGDENTGKTSLMVKYVNNTFDKQYRKTLGVNFMERSIELGTTDINFAIYDVGGGPEFINMLPVAIKDAAAVIYVFDLTDTKTLDHLREWYKLSKESNQNATPMLVGTKYDILVGMDLEYQEEIHKLSLKFARAMGASVVFTSTSDSINVQKVFKILISKVFDLQIRIPEIRNVGEPLLIHRLQ